MLNHGVHYYINFITSMGKRKIRFDARKNYERKKHARARAITQPQHDTELVVTLPRSAYTTAAVAEVAALQSRLTISHTLPNDWISTLLSSNDLALYKLTVSPPLMSAKVQYMLTISNDLSWVLCIGQKEIKRSECQMLQDVGHLLSSVEEVISLLVAIDNSKICVGNPDEKFNLLNDRHKGIFRGQSGKLDNYFYIGQE